MVSLNIKVTANNTIGTICNDGKVIMWKSVGCLGFTNTKKSTPYASQKLTEVMLKDITRRKLVDIWVNINGYGPGREAVLKSLMVYRYINILGMSDKTRLRHNGCRPKKIRRV
ncbi:small ribosomal subunit protein uS11 [Candidatus Vidania fulgoroideorum]